MPDALQPASFTAPPASRWRFAARWALAHLAICLAVAALSAALVFGLWYPDPWRQMLGVAGIFGLVVVADVVCGPLLTLVLASPRKSRRERWVDLSLVVLIQLAALGYGLWSVFAARPVVLAFEVDRLVVVTANEVQVGSPLALPWAGLRRVSLRQPASSDEFLQSVLTSIEGVTQAMRPDWWRPFEEARAAIDRAARPLADLVQKRPAQRETLERAAQASGRPVAQLRFLPLTSSKDANWVALLDPAGEIVGHAPVDGFD